MYVKGPQVFQKSSIHLQILGTRTVTWRKCCRPKILEWPVNLTINWQCLIGTMNDTHFCT
jgi:hypothetical protein